MSNDPYELLSRRERQIMDILLELGEASAEDVRSRLPDPPSYSAARAMLVKLENKGYAAHREKGMKYRYVPRISRDAAKQSAVERLVDVFFGGSISEAVAGMVDAHNDRLTEAELGEITRVIERVRGMKPEGHDR